MPTLFDKIWARHTILVSPEGMTLLHVARHLVHEGSAQAFRTLQANGLRVRRPDRTFAVPDHYVATTTRGRRSLDDIAVPERREMVAGLAANAHEHGITLF